MKCAHAWHAELNTCSVAFLCLKMESQRRGGAEQLGVNCVETLGGVPEPEEENAETFESLMAWAEKAWQEHCGQGSLRSAAAAQAPSLVRSAWSQAQLSLATQPASELGLAL